MLIIIYNLQFWQFCSWTSDASFDYNKYILNANIRNVSGAFVM